MKEESCWKVKQNTSCRASGTHLDSCLPLPPKIPEHKNKSKLIAGVVKNSVSSPVLTTLITPVRMKNLRDVTEGEKLKMSHVEDQEPWQSLSPESSYHLHCSHDEKVLQPSAEKRASRHVWRRLPLWALCKDCALKAGLADMLVRGEAFPNLQWVHFGWWKLSPLLWLLPSSSELLKEQSVLQTEENCRHVSEGLSEGVRYR